MLVEQARLNVISNNLANVNTAGYKEDRVVTESFRGLLLKVVDTRSPIRRSRPVGELGSGAEVVRSYSRFSSGALRHTGNPFDVALVGDGFFTIQTDEGERYTRNGSFHLDQNSVLVTDSGYPVLGLNGPIVIRGNRMDIDSQGRVIVDGRVVDRLYIVDFEDTTGLVKEAGQYFRAADGALEPVLAEQVTVSQGDLEQSNVNVVKEMVNMINAARSYEVSQKVIQAQDEMLGKAVNEVGQA